MKLRNVLSPDALTSLSRHFGGCTVYVPKRARLDGETIRKRREEGRSVEQIAAEFGVCPRTIYNYLR